MDDRLFEVLCKVCLAMSAAIVPVLLARRPVRARFGARAAYQLWLLVPCMMLAAALPSLRVSRQIVVDAIPVLTLRPGRASVNAAMPLDWDAVLLVAWLAGAIVAAALFLRAHRRYATSLGPLTGADGLFVAATSEQGPALLGLFRPRIVLPADFATRYDADEQRLIIAHEQRHAIRRDPCANAAIALLQCAFWFNPLVHLAAMRCRFDQELACDADVIAHHPGQIRAYAAAMLKTQVGGAAAPLTCHWQSSHPLKERIMQLNHPQSGFTRRLAGRALFAVLVATGVLGTVMARAEAVQKDKYLVEFKIEFEGEASAPSVLVNAGEPFSMAGGKNGKTWKGDYLVTKGKDGLVWLKSQYSFNGNKPGGTHNGGSHLGEVRHMVVTADNGKHDTLITVDVGVKAAPGAN